MLQFDGRPSFGESSGYAPPPFTGRASFEETSDFVHILDENTVGIILGELDTIGDFVAYLEAKENFLYSGVSLWAAGEEDVLAYYLTNTDASGSHGLLFDERVDTIMLEEGFWESYKVNSDRRRKQLADRTSYFWDDLIEIFTDNRQEMYNDADPLDIERVLRGMAAEKRYQRRGLANMLRNIINYDRGSSDLLSRTLRPSDEGHPFYLFMSLRQPIGTSRDEYLKARMSLLVQLCHAVKARYPDANQVIGVASDLGATEVISFDAFFADLTLLSNEDVTFAVKTARMAGLFKHHNERSSTVFEYPKELDSISWAKGRKRNSPCFCGSGLKYKHCCGRRSQSLSWEGDLFQS